MNPVRHALEYGYVWIRLRLMSSEEFEKRLRGSRRMLQEAKKHNLGHGYIEEVNTMFEREAERRGHASV
jgi:hypothetical protein